MVNSADRLPEITSGNFIICIRYGFGAMRTFLYQSKAFTLWFILWVIGFIYACDSPSSTVNTSQSTQPVTGLTTSLEDEIKDLPNGQISWSTYWKLCWEPYPEAIAYELQIMTSEGVSPRPKRQQDSCYRLQIATGQNAKEEGMLNRESLLSLQMGMLTYQVRAVLDEQQVSAWSAPVTIDTLVAPQSHPYRTKITP